MLYEVIFAFKEGVVDPLCEGLFENVIEDFSGNPKLNDANSDLIFKIAKQLSRISIVIPF